MATARADLLERLEMIASRYMTRSRHATSAATQTLLRPHSGASVRPSVAAKGFDPQWTHPLPPPDGYSHSIVEPAIDLEGVLAGDDDAVAPLPDTTPICPVCRQALLLNGTGDQRIWALPCGHVLDGFCVARLGKQVVSDGRATSAARVFTCPVPHCKQRCHPEPGHRHSACAAATPSSARTILGIESSCDDSCASVVTSDRRILSSVAIRQDHAATQGIHPLHAAHGHHANVPAAIAQALADARVRVAELDAVAVTQGPGMPSCLAVGMAAAKTLSAVHAKPIIYVHHMRGSWERAAALTAAHALTPLLTEAAPPEFPFLTLLVSGGHTMLVLVHSVARFEVLATTLDDSVGNTFDKFARALGLGWQSASGALVEQLAAEHVAAHGDGGTPALPRILLGAASSGLKSAAMRLLARRGGPAALDASAVRALAHDFQRAAFAPLEDKITRAVATDGARARFGAGWRLAHSSDVPASDIRAVVCSGGVASNMYLRARYGGPRAALTADCERRSTHADGRMSHSCSPRSWCAVMH
ncbi:N(6)-L-threonylcarbamoyladenine synthase [Malassezia sp. CBS 17886]|nr:N(6)-L-threonylcarbamoyladenine synthase [Malassezia sp. CBS 17886]